MLLPLPLIDEGLSLSQRIGRLGSKFEIASQPAEIRLQELIVGKEGQSWTRTCAIFACTKLGLKSFAINVENALGAADVVVWETAVWALHTLDSERYQNQLSYLANETELRISSLIDGLNRADQKRGRKLSAE